MLEKGSLVNGLRLVRWKENVEVSPYETLPSPPPCLTC